MLMPLSQGAHFVHPATEQGLSKSPKSCMNFLMSSISTLSTISHKNVGEQLEVAWCCLVLMPLSQGAHFVNPATE